MPNGTCVVRGTENRCVDCDEVKPCDAMQMRRGLPHQHSPGVCKRCRSKRYVPKPADRRCACGALMGGRSARCWACYQADRRAGKYRCVGARYTTSDGYVAVVQPDHPDANTNGLVPEHRLVMERLIGRRLLKSESVHHRNGDRSDNTPGNLQLWTRPQPTGVAVDDAVEHAIATLRLYAPEALADGMATAEQTA